MNNDEKALSQVKEEFLAVHLNSAPQLTPTGKISYAKTRVYTQRYRTAWEQMPDFKGWLTAVPDQPTRAFCTYCRKNLHAHRLSLLKHTCTMKHQRCALMQQNNALAQQNNVVAVATEEKDPIAIDIPDDPDEMEETAESFKLQQSEGEDDDEEIEYVVERLDDENMDEEQCKDAEDIEYAEDEEEENLPVAKKIKMEKNEMNDRQDALAEAMAHVHGEYLDENGDPVNVELEMVVESVDSQPGQIRMVSMQSGAETEEDQAAAIDSPKHDENSGDYIQEQDGENEDSHRDTMGNTSSCKSSMHGAESSEGASDTEEPEHVEVHRVNMPASARRDYLIKPSMGRTVSVGTSRNNGTASMGTKKTITLTSGGKIVSLDTSAMAGYAGGSRYVLNVAKGQASAVVPDSEKDDEGSEVQGQTKTRQQQQQAATVTYSAASTSQPSTRKHIILKSVKPVVAKKPYISTHVLDTSKGLPVGGLQISLYKLMDGRWTFLNESTSTADGRCADLLDTAKYRFTAGRYKLHYDVDKYFTLRRIETMYPFIEIIFDVKNPTEHYHLPVLLSPFGYTTYRGS